MFTNLGFLNLNLTLLTLNRNLKPTEESTCMSKNREYCSKLWK
jgi:hypothetical protein